MLGIDAKNGSVAIDGWATETSQDAAELAKDMKAWVCDYLHGYKPGWDGFGY